MASEEAPQLERAHQARPVIFVEKSEEIYRRGAAPEGVGVMEGVRKSLNAWVHLVLRSRRRLVPLDVMRPSGPAKSRFAVEAERRWKARDLVASDGKEVTMR